MSDLFYTGRSRRTSGAFSVTMRDGAKLAKKLEKLKDGGETVIKRTVSDFTARAPGWVSKGIRQEYGISLKGMNNHAPKVKKGGASFTVAGIPVDNARLEYESELLTPTNFGMKVSTVAKKKGVPGQMRVSAAIIKGKRKNLPPSVFIASAKNKNENEGPALPFQRKGPNRYPLEVIKTVAVPQMIDNRAHDTIEQNIHDNLEKRIANHVKQVLK